MADQSSIQPPTGDDPGGPAAHDDAYVVVARRYRPQTFEELVGQQHVARALTGAISTGRVGHAYLFTGARGVGKTSAARILAKALNCVRGPTATPCNQCDVCHSISTGEDMDVLEIDGASNRGIDEIRQLRANVGVRPGRALYKIYIIDEVHMLTREAFNALLKTLEEPPEHVKFIFCTTEPNKLPITILSRCQRFDFAGIQTASIVRRLAQISEAEGVSADGEALQLLARRAAGSMRDSQSLLEQLLAFGGETITAADVHAMLGTASDARLAQLVGHLARRDTAAALADLDAALAEGCDVGQLIEQLLGYYRDAMTLAVGCGADTLLYVAPSEANSLGELAGRLGLHTILAAIQIVDQALARMRQSTHNRTLAEMALVRIAALDDLDELPALIAELRGGPLPGGSPASPSPSTGPPARPARGAASLPPSPPSATGSRRPSAAGTPSAAEATSPDASTSAASSSGSATAADGASTPLTAENARQIWRQALSDVSDLVAEHAEKCERVATSAPNRLVVSFKAQYTFSKEICERADQLAKIEKSLARVTGQRVKIGFELIPDEPASARRDPAARQVTQRQLLAEATRRPVVQRTMELFDAQPTKVVPGPVEQRPAATPRGD